MLRLGRMKRLILALGVLAAIFLGAAPTPAHASGKGIHYGMNAKVVANKLDCRRDYRPGGGDGAARFHIKDSVVCWLKGTKRVNVITFRDKVGQTRWEDYMIDIAAVQGYPQHWASADGVTIVARNGNRPAACAGKRALRGAKHVGAYSATAEGWVYDCK